MDRRRSFCLNATYRPAAQCPKAAAPTVRAMLHTLDTANNTHAAKQSAALAPIITATTARHVSGSTPMPARRSASLVEPASSRVIGAKAFTATDSRCAIVTKDDFAADRGDDAGASLDEGERATAEGDFAPHHAHTTSYATKPAAMPVKAIAANKNPSMLPLSLCPTKRRLL